MKSFIMLAVATGVLFGAASVPASAQALIGWTNCTDNCKPTR